jgi:acetyl/propionyl-CoA carboxylase alpha subunit
VPAAIEPDPQRFARVFPPIAGRVVRLHVQLGDLVTSGQVLATLHSPDFVQAQGDYLKARSTVQVATAEGSTRKADLNLGAALFGGGGGGAIGGYGNTNEGKIIAAAFLDNYKKIVAVVRGDASLQRNVGTLKQEAAAGGSTQAGEVFNEGDVVVPKIGNVKLFAGSDGVKAIGSVQKGEALVVVGAEQNGYVNVQSGDATGWVKKVLVTRP